MARKPASPEAIPEPDRFSGAPHPRETERLFGHDEAERTLLDAWRGGRMHHAWLIGGAEGIGKATLAYRLARFVLAHPDPAAAGVDDMRDLSVPRDNTAARQVAALGHPDLMVLRRGWDERNKRLKTVITVDEVRRAGHFFHMSAGAGGWRVAVVDAADEMNPSAANALLKTLEEPPAKALILLISHAPGGLLPTIRSRCRRLMLGPLDREALLAALAQAAGQEALDGLSPGEQDELVRHARGSVRRAMQLMEADALAIFRDVEEILEMPAARRDRRLHTFADKVSRRGADEQFAYALTAIMDWLAARVERGAQGGAANLARLAEVWEKVNRLAGDTATYHFDRKQVILNAFRSIAAAVS